MNRMVSQVLTSAEKMAARASEPIHTGSSDMTTVGSTRFALARSGWFTRAAMPSRTGRNEKAICATAAVPSPMRTVRAFTAP